ncbi:hypothetical protein DFH11DRAFT_512937 [Phellopilus nigrolimitatus]|nr:hypothetical protein DFH11DRAFT_512937 [Phellopilus nigrolimitatus]
MQRVDGGSGAEGREEGKEDGREGDEQAAPPRELTGRPLPWPRALLLLLQAFVSRRVCYRLILKHRCCSNTAESSLIITAWYGLVCDNSLVLAASTQPQDAYASRFAFSRLLSLCFSPSLAPTGCVGRTGEPARPIDIRSRCTMASRMSNTCAPLMYWANHIYLLRFDI